MDRRNYNEDDGTSVLASAEPAGAGAAFSGREAFVDLKTVALFLAVSIRTLHRLIVSSDCFPAHRIGRVWRFRLSEVDRWMQHNTGRTRRRKR